MARRYNQDAVETDEFYWIEKKSNRTALLANKLWVQTIPRKMKLESELDRAILT